MKILFYPLAAVTFIAVLLLMAGIQTDSVAMMDAWGRDLFGGFAFITVFEFFGSELFLGAAGIMTILFLWFRRKNYLGMVIVLAALAGGNVLNKGIKQWIERDRPLSSAGEVSFSFPSGHAMVSLIAVVVIFSLLTEDMEKGMVKIVLFMVGVSLSVLAGLSRVTDEAHYFSDVIGGWLLGYTYAIVCLLVYERLLKRRRTKFSASSPS
ncbi:phosphatase PAP2 family protein [Jeotgalibacillus soli]|uniref:Phosphatidic acid phosphatase type 2/haloperoxidase domain-containing protein n=1 Tax=Jeotgalibacillus soli TaxID=889306 RepID=A0A0C2VNN0_9BACL|nr:phosphatase PAP2 family protein [Jeotgalibacillus soli]KIL45608.1 hypothetical protein KP78_19570 [Jeotgalibacillus soli]